MGGVWFTRLVFNPCTNFTSVFRAKRRLTSHSASEVADQSQVSGCLVTSGRCWPSAADEEWYSPKRPSSTVAVNELNTKVSAFSLVFSFQLDGMPFLASFCALRGTGRHCLCLRPSWDQMAARTTTVDVSCT